MKTAYEARIKYDFSVFPIGKDKRPLINWKEFQDRKASDEEMEDWREKYPDVNYGIVTGKISGITVIDVDVYKGGKIDGFPETYTVRTGRGGYHLYYTYKEGPKTAAEVENTLGLYGIDIKNDGGYVVGPGSVSDFVNEKTRMREGGEYTVVKDRDFAEFPLHLFPQKSGKNKSKKLGELIGKNQGSRNDSLTSMVGKLLLTTKEKDWDKEVWPAVVRINKTYDPPLKDDEVLTIYNSICKAQRERMKTLIVSPLQPDEFDPTPVKLMRSKNGVVYNNLANAITALEQHPLLKYAIRFNTFTHEIEYNGKKINDHDILKIQERLQTECEMPLLGPNTVFDAIKHRAHDNEYDEAQEWLTSLVWDGIERLTVWLPTTVPIEENEYTKAVGTQWFMGMIRRIMEPGCVFDYALLLIGGQGIGKTSMFRIIGGPWYKSFSGALEGKDYLIKTRGAVIFDLDEGAAIRKTDAVHLKSIITEVEDEYREPYGKTTVKFPRRYVFSMSTNDVEPFRDMTGNRRFWTVYIESKDMVNFKWLQESRDQLFAEAYFHYKNKTKLPQVDFDRAREIQEQHTPEDPWAEPITEVVESKLKYRTGSADFRITCTEVFKEAFPDARAEQLDGFKGKRVADILRTLGLEAKKSNGKNVFRLTRKKIEELQKNSIELDGISFNEYPEMS